MNLYTISKPECPPFITTVNTISGFCLNVFSGQAV